jgi:hypothetical protein
MTDPALNGSKPVKLSQTTGSIARIFHSLVGRSCRFALIFGRRSSAALPTIWNRPSLHCEISRLAMCLRIRPKSASVRNGNGEGRRRDADGSGRDDRAPQEFVMDWGVKLSQTQSNLRGRTGGLKGVGVVARPEPDPLHEDESKGEPPHPDPLLHKCVEKREMERRAGVLGIRALNSSANSLPHERVMTGDVFGGSRPIKPNQTKSNLRGAKTRRADSSELPNGSDAGCEGAARGTRGACAPRKQDMLPRPYLGWLIFNGLQEPRCLCIGDIGLGGGIEGKWLVATGQCLGLRGRSADQSNPVKPSQTEGD